MGIDWVNTICVYHIQVKEPSRWKLTPTKLFRAENPLSPQKMSQLYPRRRSQTFEKQRRLPALPSGSYCHVAKVTEDTNAHGRQEHS